MNWKWAEEKLKLGQKIRRECWDEESYCILDKVIRMYQGELLMSSILYMGTQHTSAVDWCFYKRATTREFLYTIIGKTGSQVLRLETERDEALAERDEARVIYDASSYAELCNKIGDLGTMDEKTQGTMAVIKGIKTRIAGLERGRNQALAELHYLEKAKECPSDELVESLVDLLPNCAFSRNLTLVIAQAVDYINLLESDKTQASIELNSALDKLKGLKGAKEQKIPNTFNWDKAWSNMVVHGAKVCKSPWDSNIYWCWSEEKQRTVDQDGCIVRICDRHRNAMNWRMWVAPETMGFKTANYHMSYGGIVTNDETGWLYRIHDGVYQSKVCDGWSDTMITPKQVASRTWRRT